MTNKSKNESEKHHRAKFDFSVVRRARELREYWGYPTKKILKILEEEGHSVPWNTLNGWLYYRTRVSK